MTRERLVEVGRTLGVSLPSNAKKDRQVEAFLEAAPAQLAAVVALLQRDELKVICRLHGLPDGGRARFELAWSFHRSGIGRGERYQRSEELAVLASR